MSMLQYRHKSRAWLQMVTADDNGNFRAIKDIIAQGIAEGDEGSYDLAADRDALLRRLIQIRERLTSRIEGLPDDARLRAHLDSLSGPLIHTLLVSGPWDTTNVGGEEVDVDWLFEEPQPRQPAASGQSPRLLGEPRTAPSSQLAHQ
jgi:hypothetical protein